SYETLAGPEDETVAGPGLRHSLDVRQEVSNRISAIGAHGIRIECRDGQRQEREGALLAVPVGGNDLASRRMLGGIEAGYRRGKLFDDLAHPIAPVRGAHDHGEVIPADVPDKIETSGRRGLEQA